MIIAIIDDDTVFRQVLGRSLSNQDCKIVDYDHPKPLLDVVIELDIILLDLQLAEDNGLKWIEPLRASYPDSQIILLTGYASIATAVDAIKLGADDYLSKPCTGRDILNHVQGKQRQDTQVAEPAVMSVNRLEWEHIQRVLNDHEGNISAAARALGMHRRTLQRKLQKRPAKN